MTTADPIPRKRIQLALVVILVLAASIDCSFLVKNPYPHEQSGGQGEVARNILRGHWFVENKRAIAIQGAVRERERRQPDPADVNYAVANAHPNYFPYIDEVVGPGTVLAAIWEITGSERYVYGEILQVLINLGMVLLVYRIAMLLFARYRAALIAACLYALFLPIARQASIVDPDIWGVYFTIVGLDLYLEAMRTAPGRRWRWLLACGLTIGVGTYFRVNVLLLPPALMLASLRWPRMVRPLRSGIAIVLISFVPMIPWTVKNYVEFDRFMPFRTSGGVNLWQGLGELPNNFGANESDVITAEQVARERPDIQTLSPQYNEYLQHKAIEAIEQHPVFYAEIVGRRILYSTFVVYESAWMHASGESPVRYHARTGKGLLSYAFNRPFELLQSLLEPVMFVLAMLGLALAWRGWRREHLLLIAALLSALIPYWILHIEPRYILPTSPIYLMWIALGGDLLGERLRRRRTHRDLREAMA